MKKIFSKMFVILTTFLILSCDTKVDEHQIYGTYYAEYLESTDKLIISSNFEYTHKYSKGNGEKTQEEGTWGFESFGRETHGVTFTDFVFRKENNTLGKRGYWHTSLEKSGSKFRLCFDYDLNLCFEKKE